MPTPVTIPLPLPLVATTEQVHHRITSAVVDGFSQWWQMPLLVAAFAALAAFAIWMVRRDAAELPRGVAVLELGQGQQTPVEALARDVGLTPEACSADLGGVPRALVLRAA